MILDGLPGCGHELGFCSKVLIFIIFLCAVVALDVLVRPRAAGLRSLQGMVLLVLLAIIPGGLFLAICGNPAVSAGLAIALIGLFTMISNAKRAMLGEALVFSDLALLGAVFRHPQFYFSALTSGQKALLAFAAPIMPLLLWASYMPDPRYHLAGLAFLGSAVIALRVCLALPPWHRLAQVPDSEADVARHGLIPTVLLYWLRWRASADQAPPCAVQTKPAHNELLIIVQCESFADPVDLFGDQATRLPALDRARAQAWQHGRLLVAGFGAYTMRSEYGVLFGRSEAELGFRRFDPFLTAAAEGGFALPSRLAPAGWRSVFVHPHDMRFYNRQEIMQAAGFAELVGEDRFAPPGEGEGRYISDAAIADEIGAIAGHSQGPTMIYAVTIENHGPWKAAERDSDLRQEYLRLLAKGDAMLANLMTRISGMKRPATLVFFGDHRPSIPGEVVPGGERHTPYVILRFDGQGHTLRGKAKGADISPAELHHATLAMLPNRVVPEIAAADH